jgi:hypothetical protein
MSTIQTVKTQIQSLIDLANTTTGNQDTNLTDGVNALVGGYGQGGSSGGYDPDIARMFVKGEAKPLFWGSLGITGYYELIEEV